MLLQPITIASPDDIDREFAARAFHGTSFDPEKRGDARRQTYADAVNGLYAEFQPLAVTQAQQDLLAAQMQRYRDGYKERMTAYLASHANVISPMIAGPANFPAARNRKRAEWADNKAEALWEWDAKARASIKRKLLDARPQEDKDAEDDAALKSLVDGVHVVSLLADKIERMARNGQVRQVKHLLKLIRQREGKPLFTARHRVWTFEALAEAAANRMGERQEQGRKLLAEGGGVQLWADYGIDRVQLAFPGKPGDATLEKLKRSGWKWSPRNGVHQRQLTPNGVASGRAILASL